MKLAIMQPYFFPYIGYWQLIYAVDTFIIYDDVNFINKGYVNRNFILVNDCEHLFTLELVGASQNKKILEIQVGGNREKLLKTIVFTYRKAPYFEIVFPLLERILLNPEKNLAEFIGFSLLEISNYLNLDTQFIYSSRIDKNESLKGEKKIIDICKQIKSTQYINTIGGQKLYTKKSFLQHGIELCFMKSKPIEYQQFKDQFIPHLSIIDVLMFNDKTEVQKYLTQFEFV